MLFVLLLGFGGAGMMGACDGSEPDSASSTSVLCPLAGTGACEPSEPTECPAAIEKPCMRYRIELMGNPHDNAELGNKYKTAFGSACYLFEKGGFGCFYRKPQKACEDAVLVPDVFGAAAYEKHPKTCKNVPGTENYSLQIGPNPANVTYMYYEDAPLETSLIDVNGVPTAVNGPYRNLPDPQVVGPGEEFEKSSGFVGEDGLSLNQKKLILQVNRNAHKGDAGVGEIHSDLAGFVYPCDKNDPSKMCTEPLVLKEGDPNDPDAPQVHHVVRRKDLRCCAWGTNSYKNAVVISRRLNIYLRNNHPSAEEITWINNVPPYTL